MSATRRAPVVVTLPLPPRELSPNARIHWRKKAPAVAQYRADSRILALQVKNTSAGPWPLTPPVRATVQFTVKDMRRRDSDNLLASCKPLFDGLVDAGLLHDDSAAMLSLVLEPVVVGEPGVRIVLEAWETLTGRPRARKAERNALAG